MVYTTGSYVIREVACEFCDNKLGVTYVVAPNVRNQYKAVTQSEIEVPGRLG